MEINVLGVSGSPIKEGNTEVFLSEALKTAEGLGNVSTELIRLAGKTLVIAGTATGALLSRKRAVSVLCRMTCWRYIPG